MPVQHPRCWAGLAAWLALALLVALPPRAVAQPSVSFRAAAVAAYNRRVALSLDYASDYVVQWASKPNPVASPYYESIWLVGAALTRASNATVRAAALRMAGSLAVQTLTPGQYFTGGNMGWPAWATAAVYAQFQPIFDADPTPYNLTYPLDPRLPATLTSPQNISTLLRTAFKYGDYRPWDSTSNHLATNAAARFLIEYTMPGECTFWYNGSSGGGSFGEARMEAIAKTIPVGGFGEYGSPNYGPYNYMILLSLATLDPARVAAMRGASPSVSMTNLVALAASSYRTAVLQVAIYWFKGHWAMATGRGYPITGFWGAGDSNLGHWLYFGGEFPSTPPAGTAPLWRFSGSVKSTGLVAALGAHAGFQMPADIIMAGAVERPRFVRSRFASNFQSSYMTATYAHYSEAGRLWQQASWRARVAFLFNTTGAGLNRIYFNPGTFAVNPSKAYSVVVDPVRLNVTYLYGSTTYGTSEYENFLHSDDAVLQVTHIQRNCTCVKGVIIYVPVPSKQEGQYFVQLPPNQYQDYVMPALSADGRKLFYGYGSVFVAVLSHSAIVEGTKLNVPHNYYKEFGIFYNIYGSQDGSIVDNSQSAISIGLAMETASPSAFPGVTLADKFKAFVAQYEQRAVPQLIATNAVGHPTFSYTSAAGVNMTLAWQLGTTGTAYLSQPGQALATQVNYTAWPFLYQEVVAADGARSTWVNTVNGSTALSPVDFLQPSDTILE